MLTDLLKSLALLGGFLLLGVFLRAKIPVFQKTFIPASVIGGFLLLLLGPQCFNLLPVPAEWFSVYSLLPGVLIVPVVAAVPLGLTIGGGKSGEDPNILKNVFPLIGIGFGVSMLQFAVGYFTHLAFAGSYDLYDVFGIELAIGFVGGHGTAGTLGNMLSELNLPYWETSQGVATTTATFGIVGGILIGIAMINWAARNGQTALLKKPADIPEPIRIGYERDIKKQPSVGRETTMSSSIDTMAFHAALIFLACGLAYLILKLVKGIPVLSDISVWAYGMIVMFIIWGVMCKLKIDYLVDGKIKSKISSSFTEFAVIAAIASLPIQAAEGLLVRADDRYLRYGHRRIPHRRSAASRLRPRSGKPRFGELFAVLHHHQYYLFCHAEPVHCAAHERRRNDDCCSGLGHCGGFLPVCHYQ